MILQVVLARETLAACVTLERFQLRVRDRVLLEVTVIIGLVMTFITHVQSFLLKMFS